MKLYKTPAFHSYIDWYESNGHYSVEVLDRLVESMYKDAGNVKSDGSGRLRPSNIGNKCDRLQVLSYRGESSDFKGNWYSWSGTWLHLAFQSWLLVEYGHLLRIEHDVAPDEGADGVTGKTDWYWYGDDAETSRGYIAGRHFGDYKTINSLERVKNGPLREHRDQVGYELVTRGMNTGYIVYQQRAYGDISAYRMVLEDADIAVIKKRLKVLGGHARAGTLPPMLDVCKAFGSRFKQCGYADACLKEHMESN